MPISTVREGQSLRAFRLSRWVDDQFAERTLQGAAVVSVFARVVNLRLRSGHMLSLSAPELPLAPNGVALGLPPGLPMEELGIRSGQSVTLTPLGLKIPEADLEIRFAEAIRWEPRPRVGAIAAGELSLRIRVARSVAIAEGKARSLLPLLREPEEEMGDAVSVALINIARPAVARLRDGAARSDGAAVADAARRIAGLGPGLTPSGDDLLAGFAAAWALSAAALDLPRAPTETVSRALLAGGSAGASDLGRAWIEHGVHGEVAEPMGRFFATLFAEEPGELRATARGVLALGDTSGTDWLVGAILGTEAALNAEARR